MDRPRVMAACWGPGSPATALAMLDEAGQLAAFMFAGALSGPLRPPHPNDPPLFHDENRKARANAFLRPPPALRLSRPCRSGRVGSGSAGHARRALALLCGPRGLLHPVAAAPLLSARLARQGERQFIFAAGADDGSGPSLRRRCLLVSTSEQSVSGARPGAQKRDAERIRDFILEHKPHVLLVGGANMACRQLKADLTAVRDYILETIPHFFTRCAPARG